VGNQEFRIRILETSVPDPKLIISDPDPDPQTENQEFRIRIRIRILDPDPSVTRDGEKKVVNFDYYEGTNGLKSLTFFIFQVLCMKL